MNNFRKVFDSMKNIGIYIIEKESHTIIYCNQKFKELVPKAEVSLGCYEIGMDICGQCPLEYYESNKEKENIFLRESKVYGGMVEISVEEMLWEDKIPAYVMMIIPQLSSEETRDYYIHDHVMDTVVNKICEETYCCNLTKNIYKRYTWNNRGNLQYTQKGTVDQLLESFLSELHTSDQRRCRKVNTAKKLESYFRHNKNYLHDELRLYSPEGTYRWISCRMLPLENMYGKDTIAVMVIRDINTRKTLQEQMQHNLATTYKAIPGGVCTMMLDKKLTIISANEEFYKMLGKKEEDYANGYLEHIYPEDQIRILEHVEAKQKKKENIDITYRVMDDAGEIRWLQVRGIHFGEASGYPIYLMLRTDITLIMEAQKQIEEEQARYKKYADNVIDTLSNLVEFRDLASGEHIKRTRGLTRIILECYNKKYPEFAISSNTVEKISRAAALHDVGKIAITDTILNKPAKLTQEEMEVMKTHTLKGYEIIKALDIEEDREQKQYSMDIAKYHHERWDGKGYPEHLKGDEIPLWSQVVSIVDVYDALVSPRVYKEAYTHEKSIKMILGGECGTFNPMLLECMKDTAPLLKNEYK